MSTQTDSAALQTILSPEVLAFACETKVEQYLQPLIELARQVYPSATRFDVNTEDDPEFPDRHIVFPVDVPLSVEQSLAANRRCWYGDTCKSFCTRTPV